MATDVKITILGDSSHADAALKNLVRTGENVTSVLERDFRQLGTTSEISANAQRAAYVAAFERIKNSGSASALEVGQAFAALQAKLAKLDGGNSIKTTSTDLREMAQSSGGAHEKINLLDSSFNAFKTTLGALGITASIGGIVSLSRSVIESGIAMERTTNAMSAVTGSSAIAREELKWIRDESNRLGLEMVSTTDAFTKFAASAMGTSLQGESLHKVFSAVSSASTVLGLSAEQTQGAFTALGQMMSKGTVQAEELRGQLGERVPGAFNIAAAAMGVTTAELGKMLEKGEVMASDFLPKFADELEKRFGKQIPDAIKSTQSELNRLQNKWTELKQFLYEGGTVQGGAGLLSDALGLTKQGVKTSADLWDGLTAGILKGWVHVTKGATQAAKDAIADIDAEIERRYERRNISAGDQSAVITDADVNAKNRAAMNAAIVRELDAEKKASEARQAALFAWQDNMIESIKLIKEEEAEFAKSAKAELELTQSIEAIRKKLAAQKVAELAADIAERAELEKFVAGALAGYEAEIFKIIGYSESEIALRKTYRDGLQAETTLMDKLAIAVDKGMDSEITKLKEIILLQQQKNQKTVDELALLERKNVLTGEIVGFNNGVPIYKDSWKSQDQYQTDAQLAGAKTAGTVTVSGLGSGGDINAAWGSYFPSYSVGTDYVPRTGLALVHQGERIVPASQNTNYGGVNITVNAATADPRTLAKSIYSELTQLGARYRH